MKIRTFVAFFFLIATISSFGQGTAFTYQGRLNANGTAANGTYDFQFIIYDGITGGAQQGPILTNKYVLVTNGVFTASMDFGAVFNSAQRWLDVSVRTNGATVFTPLAPRQNLMPAPYAVYAGAAATASTATSFSGALAGDVTGTQFVTTVAKVGGQTAANVAAGAVLANAAGSTSVASTIVKRDASGNFTAGTVTASAFNGNGASLTSLNAANVSSGKLADARLSTNVPLLNVVNTFTGNFSINGFAAGDFFSPLAQAVNQTTSAYAAPAFRVINLGDSPDGALCVSTEGEGLIAEFGNATTFVASLDTDGNFNATSFNGQFNGGLGSALSGNDQPIYLRADSNHGLAYNGPGVTNFPSGAVLPDGPVLWGFTGGALGVLNGGAKAALSWDNTGVTVNGNLNANNTSGVNWNQAEEESITLSGGGFVTIASEGNAKPGPGYFLIFASVQGLGDGNNVSLRLVDVSGSSPVYIAQTSTDTPYIDDGFALSLNWVVPITSLGGYQNFGLQVASSESGSVILGHSLTVLYVPRRNN